MGDHHRRLRQRERNNFAMSAKAKSPVTPCIVQPQPARRGEGGVLVTGTNLNGYTLAPPSKKPRESWIWKHGEPLIRESDLSLVWLCTTCHNDSVHHPIKEYILPTTSTTPAQRHMERHGFDLKGIPVHRGQKRRAGSLLEYVDRQHTADHSTLNEKGWIEAFVRWTVITNQSLRQASSQVHLQLLM